MAGLARRVNYQPKRLAHELGLTHRTLGRRFHDAFGCGPRDWLKRQRMSDGVALLGNGFSTKEVASELGFRDRSSLFRAFRLQLQHTPRKLANQLDLRVSPLDPQMGPMSQSATFLSQSATPPALRLTEAI